MLLIQTLLKIFRHEIFTNQKVLSQRLFQTQNLFLIEKFVFNQKLFQTQFFYPNNVFGPSKFLIDQKSDFPNVLILILSKLDSFQLENIYHPKINLDQEIFLAPKTFWQKIPMILLYVMTMLTKLFCVLTVTFSVQGGSKKLILKIHFTIKERTLLTKNVKKNPQNKATGF